MATGMILGDLEKVLVERKMRPPGERSYVASLYDRGLVAIGAKVVEEAAEFVEAAYEPGDAGREHLVREAADLVFHAMVLLAHNDVEFHRVEAELARRFGIGGFAEKESRPASTP